MQNHAECSIATPSRLSICLILEIEVGRKIIPQFASLVCSLFADPNNMNLFQREEHTPPPDWPRILAGIVPILLLRTNRKSRTHFRLVPTSTTLHDLEGSLCIRFQNTCAVVLLRIYTVSHSICFYAANDFSRRSTSC